ncbi:DISARM system helicase DrmA [Actinomadura rugatobispora]|uniref:DISARM system helicase DrmA n=1 Tax=Actinomadura rugatobispora TaxID=1994 RepID=A0ABW1ADJ8_9ACTN|nr:DISARM system helicase DrmA [Actinomadura rugatobispora]
MTDETVLRAPDPAVIRDELQRLVIKDLHGPLAGEFEEFRERPTDRYVLGRLAPDGTVIEPDEQDDTADADGADLGEDQTEPSAPNIVSLAPSSLGCTVYIDGELDEVPVAAEWARYERVHAEDDDAAGPVWRRIPEHGEVSLKLREGTLDPEPVIDALPQVTVQGRARRLDGHWLVSIFLVNGQPRPQRLPDSAWLFQASITVRAPGGSAPFLPRPDRASGGDDADKAEQNRLGMAYRFHPEFAVGHGTGVHVTQSPDDPMRAVEITTAAVPEYEIPYTDVPKAEDDPDLPELADLELDMKRLAELADGPPAALLAALTPLVTGYRRWIERRRADLDDPARRLERHRSDAEAALEKAELAATRIQHGIERLGDPHARRAFGFANRAMYLQRIHTMAADRRGVDDSVALETALAEVDDPDNHRWRPFQLAFVLLNLPALADPAHPERAPGNSALADLLWFPTGGGKTEAYLGLTAFTLAIRRLQPPVGGTDSGAGVAVLMRYTLRLLTIQQFQRATALICACEKLRADDEGTWGREPFRIGLWVGAGVTPNRTDHAAEWLKQHKGNRRGPARAQGSPHQLTSCPWCGTRLEPGRDVQVDMIRRRTLVICPDVFCRFGMAGGREGIPIVVVDEEIYRLLPSLIIGTVDKFAQLAWRGETLALFGRVSRRCERHGYVTDDLRSADWELSGSASHPAKGDAPAARIVPTGRLRPPDLIVQDELHLISGPLGSLVGLYETAVDRLATWERDGGESVRPKIIASTATIRRAGKQIGALFNRRTELFPPAGVDIGDSFFARQRPATPTAPGYRPGRRYIGICAHGVRMKSTLIRVYVSVLGAAQALHDKYGGNEVTDPYMTLVGYFNSLRDLGGMRRLVEDDVSTRLARADERGLARRFDPLAKELTSRLSSPDIPDVLEHLKVPFRANRARGERRPIDVLLATNMIAVGVDVSRLGVMTVAGQPKSTAEYIQATSRVGRAAPGLVFTVFNWARPRDLSHFETFEYFHGTVYRHVEALSVTPFADRAVDRGLTGVLMALVRDLTEDYNGNLKAAWFDRNGTLADHVVRYFGRRAADVTSDNRVGRAVEQHLDARLDHWNAQRLIPGRRLAYDHPPGRADEVVGLLRRPEQGPWVAMTCPTSLRDVEPGVRLLLLPEDDGLSITTEPAYAPVAEADDGDGGPGSSGPDDQDGGPR